MSLTPSAPHPIFNATDRCKSAFIVECAYCRFSDLFSSEIRDLAVVWSFYTAKTANNSYDYVEAEILLKDNITAVRRYGDAVMLKNIECAFIAVTESIRDAGSLPLDVQTVAWIYSLVSNDWRALDDATCSTLYEILQGQEYYADPLEKAVYLHCNLVRLRPFFDHNGRTACLVESISLMNGNIIPVYSTNAMDITACREGRKSYCETGDYTAYTDYFLGRQLRRVSALLPEKEGQMRRRIAGLLGGE